MPALNAASDPQANIPGIARRVLNESRAVRSYAAVVALVTRQLCACPAAAMGGDALGMVVRVARLLVHISSIAQPPPRRE
jgi:hypothetical protein